MIDLQNIHFGYKKSQPLFKGLNMQAPSGAIYGLLGSNGAGKSSLLKLISGLLSPQQGSVNVLDYSASSRDPRFLQELCYVPEDITTPTGTVAGYAKTYSAFYPRFDQAHFQFCLREFQVDGNKKFGDLSFGQKKKGILAFALATRTRLLVLDEPTNGLDIPSKSQFRKLLAASLQDEQTYFISTHQVRDLGSLIDPIIVVDSGTIVFHESVERITDKLHFELSRQGARSEDVIYEERVPGGYMILAENKGSEPSDLDLEILFNAILNQRERIRAIFSDDASNE
ncbi:MAG: ATP-binding cassette domain-containing protein [Bacteroidia bacterium]